MAVEDFSVVPGFRLCDFDVSCAAAGQCPAKEKLVSQFVGNVDEESVESGMAFSDQALLMAALTGYQATVKVAGCEGAQGDTCPPLVAMNEHPVKRTVIQGLKNVIFGRGN